MSTMSDKSVADCWKGVKMLSAESGDFLDLLAYQNTSAYHKSVIKKKNLSGWMPIYLHLSENKEIQSEFRII